VRGTVGIGRGASRFETDRARSERSDVDRSQREAVVMLAWLCILGQTSQTW